MSPVAGQPPISSTALARGPNAVLAFIGNVGTPTMVRAAPVAIETGTIFFGAFTGASTILRDDKAADCKSFIFNVRASYAQEARATMEYFKKRNVPDYKQLISFDQDDSFGQARRREPEHPDRPLPLHAQRRQQRAGAGRGGHGVPRLVGRAQ
jgi:ABC-type branched-subunit amino acid transport system substrate-binding protein